MYRYGLMLLNGTGIDVNKEEAAKYLKKSADENVIVAMHQYGLMLFDGNGIEVNKEEAAKYFKKAADLGNVDSFKKYS